MLVNVLALNHTDHHRNCTTHKKQLGAAIKKLKRQKTSKQAEICSAFCNCFL